MFVYTCNEEEKSLILNFSPAVSQKRIERDKRRNDRGPHRTINEVVGKIGEIGASKLYGGKVDFELYNRPMHVPDLNDDFVKSCSVKWARNNGVSWMIDKADPLLLKTANQRIIFVLVDHERWSVKVYGHVYAHQLVGRVGPSDTKPHKRAVWYDDTERVFPSGNTKLYKGIRDIIQEVHS